MQSNRRRLPGREYAGWWGGGYWVVAGIEDEKDGKEYKRWKIGNIGYNVGPQQLKWQQIGNTIGNSPMPDWQLKGGELARQVGFGRIWPGGKNFYGVTNRNLP